MDGDVAAVLSDLRRRDRRRRVRAVAVVGAVAIGAAALWSAWPTRLNPAGGLLEEDLIAQRLYPLGSPIIEHIADRIGREVSPQASGDLGRLRAGVMAMRRSSRRPDRTAWVRHVALRDELPRDLRRYAAHAYRRMYPGWRSDAAFVAAMQAD